MNISTVVLMIIFVFTFIPLVLAEFARNKFTYTIEDFFLQSRRMNLLMAFFTIYATWVSSFAFLGSTASFFNNGPLYMTCFAWNILFALMFMVIGRRIWFYGKTHGYITATDFFDDIYRNKRLSLTITVILILFTIPYLMIQLFGGAFLIETASNGQIPWRTAGLMFYLIIIIYLWAGGLRAVAMSDVYYGILTVLTMIITGIVLVTKAGGINTVFLGIGKVDNDFFTLAQAGESSTLMWIAMFIIIPIGAFMGPPMWIRMYAISNAKIFKTLPLLLTLITIMYIGPMLAGSAAKYLYPNSVFSDNLLVVIIMEKMPLVLAATIMCGIAAASLSTANSQIHAMAAVYTIDVHKRYIRPKTSERGTLRIGRWAVLVVSVIAYLLMISTNMNIIEMGTLSFSGTAQIFVPTVGALIWKRSNSNAATISIWCGVIISVSLVAATTLEIVFAASIGFACNILIFIIGSIVFQTDRDTATRIEEYRTKYEINRE